jgi:hypothetical protein
MDASIANMKPSQNLRNAILLICLLLLCGCSQTPSRPQSAYPSDATPYSADGQQTTAVLATTTPIGSTSQPSPAQTATRTKSSADITPEPVATTQLTLVSQASTSGPRKVVDEILIYGDSLSKGWQDWSWDTEHTLDNPAPVHTGSSSIAIAYSKAWAGFYLHIDDPIDAGNYQELRFYLHGGTNGNQKINVSVNKNPDAIFSLTAAANTWTAVNIPLSNLGSPTMVNELVWQDGGEKAQNKFYIDQISLVSFGPEPTITPIPGGIALRIDAAKDQHPISPYIYGMNFADKTLLADLHLSVNRMGGNAVTRYSWKNDTSNRAKDWFFENIPNDNSNPGGLPDGSASDQFVDTNRQAGAASILTIPLIGWTPKNREISCAYSVQKYGAQQQTDPYRPDCGNGVRQDGSLITNNDPKDTSSAIDPNFVQDWIKHLIERYGTADNGGVKFYNLDNEPALWNTNHRDVHPRPVSYDELRDRTTQYAAALKAVDPSAQTLGPVEWGWSSYFYSALDAEGQGEWWKLPKDRLLHANIPLVEWYLQQMRAYEANNGVRILDYLDLHYYPQADKVALSSTIDSKTQALRLRSTRALWDPTYKDESWIAEPVNLIPRMKDWVNKNYPGTKIALSEYNFGALDHINGALAQADVLGIFGREGLDLATLWAPPDPSQPAAYTFRMYRNYDGKGGEFGNTSIQAASADMDVLSVYAAKRSSDGALTVMVINKSSGVQNGAISIDNFAYAKQAQIYHYSKANLTAIIHDPDLPIPEGPWMVPFPANSITLIVIAKE